MEAYHLPPYPLRGWLAKSGATPCPPTQIPPCYPTLRNPPGVPTQGGIRSHARAFSSSRMLSLDDDTLIIVLSHLVEPLDLARSGMCCHQLHGLVSKIALEKLTALQGKYAFEDDCRTLSALAG